MAFPSRALERTKTYTPRGYKSNTLGGYGGRIGGAHCNCPQSRTFPLGRKGVERILLYGIVVTLSTDPGSPQGRLAGLGIGPDGPLLGSAGQGAEGAQARRPDHRVEPWTPPSSTAAHPTLPISKAWASPTSFRTAGRQCLRRRFAGLGAPQAMGPRICRAECLPWRRNTGPRPRSLRAWRPGRPGNVGKLIAAVVWTSVRRYISTVRCDDIPG